MKVSLPMHSQWKAGQHFFVRLRSMGMHSMTSHPFSACSLSTNVATPRDTTSDLNFFIRPRGGFTSRLAHWAETHLGGTLRVILDGPYGGIDVHKFTSSSRLLLIAGGSGAGWLLPLIELHLRRLEHERPLDDRADEKQQIAEKAVAKVILATRDRATQAWFEHATNELLAKYGTNGMVGSLKIEMFFTGEERRGPESKVSGQFLRELQDPEALLDSKAPELTSETAKSQSPEHARSVHTHTSGRPDLKSILQQELAARKGRLSTFLCGPLSMQSDVSDKMAEYQLHIARRGSGDAYLHIEHFAWA